MLCLTAPADYPPNLAACALYLPGQRHPGLRCAGLAAVPVPRSAGNAAGLRPACFLPLWSPMRLPSALLCHAAAAARRHTAYPSAKNTLHLRRNCFFVCGLRCAAAPLVSAILSYLSSRHATPVASAQALDHSLPRLTGKLAPSAAPPFPHTTRGGAAGLVRGPRRRSCPARKSYLSSRHATPGSSLPSRNSREAPPPVEMWVILSA